jgi:ribonuclease VapC
MVIDTSALVAILLQEPEAEAMSRAIAGASTRRISAVNRLELSIVIESRKRDQGRADIEKLLAEAQIEIAAVTPDQAELAIEAYRNFGKGRHPAGLNIGDCFAYALAKATGEPLLFKGDDFRQTDIAFV